jgi:uncharacterized protein involved in response to NO
VIPIAVRATPPPRDFALWRLGFRPFYLLASSFAALSILLWVAQYAGLLPAAYLAGPLWHGHEMLFGFALAVVGGFLFTAVRNWSGLPTPTGAALAACALLWLAGRVLVLTPFAMTAAIVNTAFPAAIALGIGIPLWKSGNRRNYFFVGLLLLLAALTLAFHLSLQGRIGWPQRVGIEAGLDIVLFIMAVVGGRVIPMFTNNGVPGTKARRDPLVERLALGAALALLAADLLQAPPVLVASIALVGTLAHGARLLLWQPWRTRAKPLVWILHAAYAWIVAYLLLRSLAGFGLVAGSFAVHALTVGAIGGLTIGMMTRTARGHTGRPLVADGWEVACYALVMAAALLRVPGAMAFPALHVGMVVASGLCWSAAYGIYAVRYWPVLTRARVDGQPG